MTKVIDFVVTWVDINNEIYSNMLIFKKGRLNFQSLRDLIPFMLFLIN